MSFPIDDLGGFGNGTANSSSFTNSYARISGSNTSFSLSNISGSFKAGDEILITASSSNGATASLGFFFVRTIISISSANITLNQAVTLDSGYYWQAVTIPHFKSFTLNSTISPIAYSDYRGGIIAFKCSDSFILAGGHINLVDKGIQSAQANLRPLTTQESSGTLDTDTYSGIENSITKDRLLLNVGDGACFILAKKVVVNNSSSRIGNPATYGKRYCRGASDSMQRFGDISNVGGSTILIATESWTNFSPAIIAKYRTNSGGKGLARCYLAVENVNIHADEGLYALDVLENKKRLLDLGIKNFGSGAQGSFVGVGSSSTINYYSRINSISGQVLNVNSPSYFPVGSLVMIHMTSSGYYDDFNDGFFKIARVTNVSGNYISIDTPIGRSLFGYAQLIFIPQFDGDISLNGTFDQTPAFKNGIGGIFALACNGTLNMTNSKINLIGKGANTQKTNTVVGNAYMSQHLPIGQGNGSAFILAKNITLGKNTRIGGTWSGAEFGGKGGGVDAAKGGGYRGADGTNRDPTYEYMYNGTGGWGGGEGSNPQYDTLNGGWFSNAYSKHIYFNNAYEHDNEINLHGAHILIVADTITNFSLHGISTGGGYGGYEGWSVKKFKGTEGGAGYGGGGAASHNTSSTQSTQLKMVAGGGAGGYRGGGAGAYKKYVSGAIKITQYAPGGGSAGAAFIYCNNAVNQDMTNLIIQ